MTSPDNTERRPIITTGTVEYRPYSYPSTDVPAYPDDILAATEQWASRVTESFLRLDVFARRQDTESKRLYLTWLTQRTLDEQTQVEELFQGLPSRPVDPLPQGSWQQQRNEGMFTCQIASAANGLNFLYPRNPRPYTERDIIEALGGQRYVAEHANGAETGDVARALRTLSPHIRTRRTNSVAEMLRAAENGAAVMFPITSNHEALIPPGHRLRRGINGVLEVQVADPLSSQPRYIGVNGLIRSEITVVEDPDRIENSVLIMEKGIQTVTSAQEGIRTVQRTPITTVRTGVQQPIRTVSTEQPSRKPIKTIRSS